MRIGTPLSGVLRPLVGAALLGVLVAAASWAACAGGGGSQSDVAPSCTADDCLAFCLTHSRPGGSCQDGACVCNEAADADADGDGDADADADADADVHDAREDGEVVRDDARTDDGADEAVTDVLPEDAGPRCADLAAAWTFNGGAEDWTHGPVDAPATGEWDPWVVGTPTGGPGGCHGSATVNECWTTGLSGDYPTCQRGELRAPTRDMSPCATSAMHVDLVFWQWHDFAAATGSNDGGLVEISGDDGATWTQVAPASGWDGAIAMNGSACEGALYTDGKQGFLGDSGGWVQETIRVPTDLLTSQFTFRFVFGSDGATGAAGWFLDDVALLVH